MHKNEGFAEALNCLIKENESRQQLLRLQSPFKAFSAPFLYSMLYPKKWGKLICFFQHSYRFLSSRNSTAPTTTIAMMIPMIPGRMYMSDRDCGIGVGSAVACGASLAVKLVVAHAP